MKIKSITFITLLLALIFVCSPIVAVAANNANSLGVPVVSGEYREDYWGVVLQWTEDPNATSYKIYRSESSTGEKVYLAQTEDLLYLDAFVRGDTYYYYVTSYNKNTGEEGYYSKVCKVEINSEQYSSVKYSDLFYVYATSYLENSYYDDYSNEVFDILNEVHDEYVESSSIIGTDIKTAIHAAVHWKDWCTLVSDSFFGTSFNYNAALDAANIKFAQNMMDEAWWGQAASELSSLASKAKKINNIFDKMGVELNYEYMTTQEIYEVFLMYLSEDNCFGYISVTTIQQMKSIDLVDLTSKGLKNGGEALDIVRAISTGMLLEDLRMEMIDRMIKLSPSDSAINQGMTRLKSQLQNGFVSYFVDSYVKDKVIDTLVDHVVSVFISGEFLKAKGWITFVVDITTDVVFFKTPDMNDLLVQRVLTEYSNDVFKMLRVQRDVYNEQFSIEDVEMYSLLYNAYVAINNAALKQSEDFAKKSNRDRLEAVTKKYKDATYEDYIDSVKDDISDQNSSDRKRKTYESWIINGDAKFSYASDTLEKNTIYLRNSTFCCDNTILKGTCTVEEGYRVFVDGNWEIRSGTLTISKGATLTVDGDVVINYGDHVYNHGTLNAVDVEIYTYASSVHGKYHQSEADAELHLTGNFYAEYMNCCDITAGTVVFEGEEQQTVTNLTAYNVEVTNPKGIKYLTHIKLYGTYDLHGNPLDDGGYTTRPYGEATFVEGSNYQDVYIDADYTLNCNMLCNNITVASTSKVTVAEKTDITLKSLLTVSGTLTISKGATLTVDGDVVINYGDHVYNHGTLNAVDVEIYTYASSVHGKYHQSEADAELHLTGNFYAEYMNCCDITAGTVVFEGEEQQTVTNLTAYNVEVTNPKGIKYLTYIKLYGTYDLHGNPLDNNGNHTYLYDGTTFSEGSNYKDLYIGTSVEVTLRSNLPCENIIVDGILNIPEGDYKITGNLSIPYINARLNIAENAELLVEGETSVGNGQIHNLGIFDVQEFKLTSLSYSYSNYHQNTEDAKLIVRKNFTATSTSCCDITAGTIIFSGSEQQTIQNLKAYNIEVLNSEGIKYLSNIYVYGNYDLHGNPIDCGSYKTNFYEGGSFGTLECNQSDWIIDENPSCGKVGSKHIECLICHEIVKQEEIPISTDHNWIFVSCEIARICEVCSAIEDIPLGHSFGDYVSNNDATYTVNGTKTAKCDRCDQTDTVTDEESALGLDQKFKDEFAVLTNDADTETTYSKLYALLQTYATLSDEEKANVATEFITVQQMINAYNEKAQTANSELADATEIAFAPIVATGFAFLAVLWFLLKKKFFI